MYNNDMRKLEQFKNQKWLVAVSGGADSMALLDMCYHANIDVYVAHVNYKKRDSADRDMNGVKAYCEKRNIPCFVHVVKSYSNKQNFQAEARDIRYSFFKQLVDKYHLQGVFVAHHKDDLIETYMMQKNRNSIPSYYGIKEEVMMKQVLIKRVLLNYTKADLIAYCDTHQITYYDDESNFENHYTRNRIRHERIDFMSLSEKNKVYQEIVFENDRLQKIREKVEMFIRRYGKQIPVEKFLMQEDIIQEEILRAWILNNSDLHVISKKHIRMILERIKHKEMNFKHNIKDDVLFILEYGMMKIVEDKDTSFSYTLTKIECLDTPYFKIREHGKTIEKVSLKEEDFPITIRNAKASDKIKLRFGTKKISRFFIDRKIPYEERKSWPVIENNMGKVIFICGIGCDICHFSNNSTMFVLK